MDDRLWKIELQNVGGRSYRIARKQNDQSAPVVLNYRSETIEVDQVEINIFSNDANMCATRLSIPKSLTEKVLGTKDSALARIAHKTDSNFSVQRNGNDTYITIVSTDTGQVETAAKMIRARVSAIREAMPVNHFVTVKLTPISDRLETFTATLTSDFDKGLFQLKERFHLTLSAITAFDSEIETVIEVCKNEIENVQKQIGCRAAKSVLEIGGLNYMGDNANKAKVLYAEVQEKPLGTLCTIKPIQTIANAINRKMLDLGFARRFEDAHAEDCVLLHATLMNSSFLKKKEGGYKNHKEYFDAEKIIVSMMGFKFGFVEIGEILLVRRHSFDEAGFYSTVKSFPL